MEYLVELKKDRNGGLGATFAEIIIFDDDQKFAVELGNLARTLRHSLKWTHGRELGKSVFRCNLGNVKQGWATLTIAENGKVTHIEYE